VMHPMAVVYIVVFVVVVAVWAVAKRGGDK
jgi:hypothetical protein